MTAFQRAVFGFTKTFFNTVLFCHSTPPPAGQSLVIIIQNRWCNLLTAMIICSAMGWSNISVSWNHSSNYDKQKKSSHFKMAFLWKCFLFISCSNHKVNFLTIICTDSWQNSSQEVFLRPIIVNQGCKTWKWHFST